MLAVMNTIVPNDGIAVGADLDSCECVTMNVVVLDQATPLSKYVHASLVAVEYFIAPRNENTTPVIKMIIWDKVYWISTQSFSSSECYQFLFGTTLSFVGKKKIW